MLPKKIEDYLKIIYELTKTNEIIWRLNDNFISTNYKETYIEISEIQKNKYSNCNQIFIRDKNNKKATFIEDPIDDLNRYANNIFNYVACFDLDL